MMKSALISARPSEARIIRAGTHMQNMTYAKYVEYGNAVAMDHMQVDYLKAFCVAKKPTKPLYIVTLQESHIIKSKGKMYFTKSYTKTHLSRHLKKERTVKVTHHKTERAYVKMKLMSSKGDTRAMMTTQWMSIVNQQGDGGKFKKGDILLFWIRRALEEAGGLKVIVKKLKPYGGVVTKKLKP
ncbi:unnamed protein product [Alopecurus aequalis]